RNADGDGSVLRVPLRADVGPAPDFEAGSYRARFRTSCGAGQRFRQARERKPAERLALLAVLGEERFGSELVDHELEPRLVLVLPVAGAVEDADDGFGDLEHFLGGREFVGEDARAAQRREAAADGDAEAFTAALFAREQ